MHGSREDAGVLPRTLAHLFALQRLHRALLSMRLVAVAGHAVTDLLTPDVLRSAGVEEGAIYCSTLHAHAVHEVLLRRRGPALKLLAHVVAAARRTLRAFQSVRGRSCCSRLLGVRMPCVGVGSLCFDVVMVALLLSEQQREGLPLPHPYANAQASQLTHQASWPAPRCYTPSVCPPRYPA